MILAKEGNQHGWRTGRLLQRPGVSDVRGVNGVRSKWLGFGRGEGIVKTKEEGSCGGAGSRFENHVFDPPQKKWKICIYCGTPPPLPPPSVHDPWWWGGGPGPRGWGDVRVCCPFSIAGLRAPPPRHCGGPRHRSRGPSGRHQGNLFRVLEPLGTQPDVNPALKSPSTESRTLLGDPVKGSFWRPTMLTPPVDLTKVPIFQWIVRSVLE